MTSMESYRKRVENIDKEISKLETIREECKNIDMSMLALYQVDEFGSCDFNEVDKIQTNAENLKVKLLKLRFSIQDKMSDLVIQDIEKMACQDTHK